MYDDVNQNHEKKINAFNDLLVTNKKFKNYFCKPFNIVYDNKCFIQNVDIYNPILNGKDHNQKINLIKKLIENPNSNDGQITLLAQQKLFCNESKANLCIIQSLMKLKSEEYPTNNKHLSLVNYFMKRRHKLHYNISFIHDSYIYELQNKETELINSLKKVMRIFNFHVEAFVFKINPKLLNEAYANFKDCVKEKERSNLICQNIEELIKSEKL
jgi:uncharacterized protein YktA (UPF0223 family)